jgi:Uma2 family endonuclease
MDGIATRNGGETGLLIRHPSVPRRKINAHEYLRMAEAGILRCEERVELIEGQLVAKPPASASHAGTVTILNRLFVLAACDRAIVSVQNPVQLDRFNEPEPDIALLKPRADGYRHARPGPNDVLLLIEVASSSLDYDRTVKRALYAAHGVAEFWIVDLDAESVEIHRDPSGETYLSAREVRAGTIEPTALAGAAIEVAALFV